MAGFGGSGETIHACFSLVLEVGPFTPRQRATARLLLARTQDGPDLRSWASRQGAKPSSFLSLLLSSNLAAIGLDHKMIDPSVQPRGTRLELQGSRSPGTGGVEYT